MNDTPSFPIIRTETLPENASAENVYVLTPINASDEYYRERTDRNIGWITKEEQEFLRGKTVGIAGCGGMGGLVAQILLRAGVGTLKISDTETFDVSNINRQFGAMRVTVGESKALATAKILRATTDDTTIYIYPKGITETYVDSFLEGCDLVLDEIEYWAVAGRILLHQKARALGIDIINCNTVGFGTRLFLFTSKSSTIEESFQITYEDAKRFEEKLEAKTATLAERIRIMVSVTLGLIPEYITYCPNSEQCGNLKTAMTRLGKEGKAPIIATNPPMASGFLADHTLLHLLRNSGVKRNVVGLPLAPGYLLFDAAKMRARVRQPNALRQWWHKKKINLIARIAIQKMHANQQG